MSAQKKRKETCTEEEIRECEGREPREVRRTTPDRGSLVRQRLRESELRARMHRHKFERLEAQFQTQSGIAEKLAYDYALLAEAKDATALTQTIATLSKERTQQINIMSSLEASLKDVGNEVETLNADLLFSKAQHAASLKEACNLRNQITEMEREGSKQRAKLVMELQEKEWSIISLKGALKGKNEEYDKRIAELTVVKDELEDIKKAREEAEVVRMCEVENKLVLRDKRLTLVETLQALFSVHEESLLVPVISNWIKAFQELQGIKEVLTKELEARNAALSMIETRFAPLKDQSLIEKIDERMKEVFSLQAQLKDSLKRNSELQTRLDGFDNERATLERISELVPMDRDGLPQAILRALEENRNLQTQLQSARDENRSDLEQKRRAEEVLNQIRSIFPVEDDKLAQSIHETIHNLRGELNNTRLDNQSLSNRLETENLHVLTIQKQLSAASGYRDLVEQLQRLCNVEDPTHLFQEISDRLEAVSAIVQRNSELNTTCINLTMYHHALRQIIEILPPLEGMSVIEKVEMGMEEILNLRAQLDQSQAKVSHLESELEPFGDLKLLLSRINRLVPMLESDADLVQTISEGLQDYRHVQEELEEVLAEKLLLENQLVEKKGTDGMLAQIRGILPVGDEELVQAISDALGKPRRMAEDAHKVEMEYKDKMKSLEDTNISLKGRLANTESKVNELDAERTRLIARLNEADKEGEGAALAENLANSESKTKELEAEKNRLIAQLDELKKANEVLDTRVKELADRPPRGDTPAESRGKNVAGNQSANLAETHQTGQGKEVPSDKSPEIGLAIGENWERRQAGASRDNEQCGDDSSDTDGTRARSKLVTNRKKRKSGTPGTYAMAFNSKDPAGHLVERERIRVLAIVNQVFKEYVDCEKDSDFPMKAVGVSAEELGAFDQGTHSPNIDPPKFDLSHGAGSKWNTETCRLLATHCLDHKDAEGEFQLGERVRLPQFHALMLAKYKRVWTYVSRGYLRAGETTEERDKRLTETSLNIDARRRAATSRCNKYSARVSALKQIRSSKQARDLAEYVLGELGNDGMSSEEDITEGDELVTGFRTTKLPWRHQDIAKLLRKLDDYGRKAKSSRGAKRAPRYEGRPSQRAQVDNLPPSFYDQNWLAETLLQGYDVARETRKGELKWSGYADWERSL